MDAAMATICRMAKKKKPGRPAGRTPKYTVYAKIPVDLGKALDAYLDSDELGPSLTSVVTVALRAFLTEKGFWPPPPSGD